MPHAKKNESHSYQAWAFCSHLNKSPPQRAITATHSRSVQYESRKEWVSESDVSSPSTQSVRAAAEASFCNHTLISQVCSD